jgi:hypothetical protein
MLLESGDQLSLTVEPQGERPTEDFDVFSSPEQTVELLAGEYHWTSYGSVLTFASKRPISGEVAYWFGGFYRGDLQTLEATISVRPVSVLILQLTTERNDGQLPEGHFKQYLYGARTEVRLSPDFQVTYFAQYDNESRLLGSAARLRWQFHPLGELFIVFNNNVARTFTETPTGATHKKWQFESDQILGKVQYSLRW